jgi:hypothetical protein
MKEAENVMDRALLTLLKISEIDQKLKTLLMQVKHDPDVVNDIRRLLERTKGVFNKIPQSLDLSLVDSKRFPGPPPGKRSRFAPGLKKFVCPDVECGYLWFSHRKGQRIPKCPEHEIELIEIPTI